MPKTHWLLAALLSVPSLNISAQNNYCCTGYGGLFADSRGVSAPEIREVATLPNAYGNIRVRLMIHRPVLQKPASCNLTKRPCLILVHGGFWAELGADY